MSAYYDFQIDFFLSEIVFMVFNARGIKNTYGRTD